MFVKNDQIYWADCSGLEDSIDDYEGTSLCADKVQWTTLDAYIGDDSVFTAAYDLSALQ